MCSNNHIFAFVLKVEFINSSSENWHKKNLFWVRGWVIKKLRDVPQEREGKSLNFFKVFFKYIKQFAQSIINHTISCSTSVYLSTSRCISVYLGLSWSISLYLVVSRCISVYIGLSRSISVYFELSWSILDYLELSRSILDHLGHLGPSQSILDHLELSQTNLDYLGISRTI